MGGLKGGEEQGVWTSSEKSQKLRPFRNTGQDSLINHKATKAAFNVGQSSIGHIYSGIWILYPIIN